MSSLSICLFWAVVTGATHVVHKSIQTASIGENVTLRCHLAEHYDVVQVTWQKEHGKVKTNIATYSKSHGSRVLGKYQSHVNISQDGMSASAITFHSITLKDEGCYNCIFNTFPLGPIPGRTCLTVYTLTEPKVDMKHVTSPNNAEGKVLEISCSITGRPAPVITWNVSRHFLIKPSQHVIHQPNQTVTVVSNFTHIFSNDVWENPIICVIWHPSLNSTREVTIPETRIEQEHSKNPGDAVIMTICILVAIFFLGLVIFAFYYCRRLLPVDKKHDLLCWILPVCPGSVICRQCSYSGNQVPVKPLHGGSLLNT